MMFVLVSGMNDRQGIWATLYADYDSAFDAAVEYIRKRHKKRLGKAFCKPIKRKNGALFDDFLDQKMQRMEDLQDKLEINEFFAIVETKEIDTPKTF